MASRAEKQREIALGTVADRLRSGEQVVAMLPFAANAPRPRALGKRREGIYQTNRRYRPLVVTDRRLFVLQGAKTPYPHGILAEFPLASVTFVDVAPRWFGQQRVRLDLPDEGVVPFDVGKFDDVDGLRAALGAG
ncbi:MAG TPA: hypothetical protein VFC99_18070 [Acidimicrobiia bacterium]|nr:hypothetical protein [Acidimicrobiia bacterium]